MQSNTSWSPEKGSARRITLAANTVKIETLTSLIRVIQIYVPLSFPDVVQGMHGDNSLADVTLFTGADSAGDPFIIPGSFVKWRLNGSTKLAFKSTAAGIIYWQHLQPANG